MTKKAGVSASRAKIFKGGRQICTKNSSLIGTKNTARRAGLRHFSRCARQRRHGRVFNTDKTLLPRDQTYQVWPLKFSTAYPLSAFSLRRRRAFAYDSARRDFYIIFRKYRHISPKNL